MKNLSIAFALTAPLAMFLSAGSASAQPRYDNPRASTNELNLRAPNAFFDPTQDTPQSIRLYGQMLEFSRCAANISGRPLAKALEAPPLSAKEVQMMELRRGLLTCGDNTTTSINVLIRGSLSEGLYKKRVKAALPAVPATSPRLDQFVVGERAFNALRSPVDLAFGDTAACLVAVKPDIAHNLFATEHGSKAEAALMDQLFGEARVCGGDKRPAGVSRSFLRSFLGEAAYRYSLFTAAAPAK